MLITQKINNNVALARDDSGATVVVFGRGVGFPTCPYELTDTSVIQKVFYEYDDKYLGVLATLAPEVLAATSEIVDMARASLGCGLNPNLVFTLADHLQFSMQRVRDGVAFDIPLVPEIALVYPQEITLGRRALEIVERHFGMRLPDSEAHAVALHLVNAEAVVPGANLSSMNLVLKSTAIIEEILTIVERTLDTTLDRSSYPYLRLTTHLRFLVGRLMAQEARPKVAARTRALMLLVAHDYPQAAACAKAIAAYLQKSHGWACSEEEELYLMLHTNQFLTTQDDASQG